MSVEYDCFVDGGLSDVNRRCFQNLGVLLQFSRSQGMRLGSGWCLGHGWCSTRQGEYPTPRRYPPGIKANLQNNDIDKAFLKKIEKKLGRQ